MTESDRSVCLIVDDEELIRELWEAIFRELDSEVVLAASVEEGVAALRQRSIDFVITDLRMPAADGEDLLKYVRGLPGPGPVTFVCSGYLNALSEASLCQQGVRRVISKPFDVRSEIAYFREFLAELASRAAGDSPVIGRAAKA